MAASIVECFKNPAIVEEAKRTFKEELGGVNVKSMLPPDQKPPVELNRAMMEKFRPAMREALREGKANIFLSPSRSSKRDRFRSKQSAHTQRAPSP